MSVRLSSPCTEKHVRKLKVGDVVLLTGRLFTGRDKLHKFLYDGGECPVRLKTGSVYHCGPVVVRDDGKWTIQASGPTTSIREEAYMPRIIEKHEVRVIVGKGGMGPATLKACAEFGCVYLEAVGGAAQVLNKHVQQVAGVHLLREFGLAEALWELDVKDFPAVVTMDAHGKSIHRTIAAASKRMLRKILKNGSPFRT